MSFTVDVRGVRVTDWLFEHAGWSFTVGRYHHPEDGSGALDMARLILQSWTWLPEAGAR